MVDSFFKADFRVILGGCLSLPASDDLVSLRRPENGRAGDSVDARRVHAVKNDAFRTVVFEADETLCHRKLKVGVFELQRSKVKARGNSKR